jgi:hypothetical protein
VCRTRPVRDGLINNSQEVDNYFHSGLNPPTFLNRTAEYNEKWSRFVFSLSFDSTAKISKRALFNIFTEFKIMLYVLFLTEFLHKGIIHFMGRIPKKSVPKRYLFVIIIEYQTDQLYHDS